MAGGGGGRRGGEGWVWGWVLLIRGERGGKKVEEEGVHLAPIVEFSGDGIVSQRLDGVVLRGNAAATRMFGYSEAEMVGTKLSLLALEDNLDDPERALEPIRAAGPALHCEPGQRLQDCRRI